jgi:hypothetical protein
LSVFSSSFDVSPTKGGKLNRERRRGKGETIKSLHKYEENDRKKDSVSNRQADKRP